MPQAARTALPLFYSPEGPSGESHSSRTNLEATNLEGPQRTRHWFEMDTFLDEHETQKRNDSERLRCGKVRPENGAT